MATAIGWPLLGKLRTYDVGPQLLHTNELVFAVILGPVAGLVGAGFRRFATWCRSRGPSGWRLPIAIVLGFAALGTVSIWFPALLGNGKGLAQLAFDGHLAVGSAIVLLIAKPLVTSGLLATGANGGLLTPAVATGAVLGAVGGTVLTHFWPGDADRRLRPDRSGGGAGRLPAGTVVRGGARPGVQRRRPEPAGSHGRGRRPGDGNGSSGQ